MNLKAPEARLAQIYKLLRTVKKCDSKKVNPLGDDIMSDLKVGCGAEQPEYKIQKGDVMGIIQEFKNAKPDNYDDSKISLSAEKARAILDAISEPDIIALGFDPKANKPSNLILTVIPVAPPQVRPSVDRGNGLISEDDLTYQYNQILKANQYLKNSIEHGQPNQIVE